MKRALLLTTLAMTIGSSAFASSMNYPNFQSDHKPMSFKMASTEDMKAYQKDLENYLADTDAIIQSLITKKRAAIDAYNAGVREYNKDDFFHKDHIDPYSYDESYSQTKRVGGHSYHTFGDTVIITTSNTLPMIEEKKDQKKDEDDAFARMMRRMERHLGVDRW